MIDSATSACGGEPESADAVSKYFTALRSLRCSSLTLCHVAKGMEASSPFGSAFWKNYPRQVFELSTDQEPAESEFNLGIVQTKTNWGSKKSPIALKVQFDEVHGSVKFERTSAVSMEKLKSKLSSKEKIYKALVDRETEMSVKELAKATKISEASLRTTLNRNPDGVFEKVGKKWGVRIET